MESLERVGFHGYSVLRKKRVNGDFYLFILGFSVRWACYLGKVGVPFVFYFIFFTCGRVRQKLRWQRGGHV